MQQKSLSLALYALIIGLFLTITASASQTDIVGPAGNGTFGSTVTVLPNGNIVVTDPDYNRSAPTVSPEIIFKPDDPFRGRISFREVRG